MWVDPNIRAIRAVSLNDLMTLQDADDSSTDDQDGEEEDENAEEE